MDILKNSDFYGTTCISDLALKPPSFSRAFTQVYTPESWRDQMCYTGAFRPPDCSPNTPRSLIFNAIDLSHSPTTTFNSSLLISERIEQPELHTYPEGIFKLQLCHDDGPRPITQGQVGAKKKPRRLPEMLSRPGFSLTTCETPLVSPRKPAARWLATQEGKGRGEEVPTSQVSPLPLPLFWPHPAGFLSLNPISISGNQ